MSRLISKNRHGRQPLLSTPKVAKSKEHLNDTYQDTDNKKQKPGRTYAATVQQAKQKRRAPSTPAESSASSSDAEDEASEDESESDEDEPLENAPSLNSLVEQTGRPFLQNEFDGGASDAGSVASMFDPNFHFEDGDPELFPMHGTNKKVFLESDDDNDDEAYKAVDDISDSDDDDAQAYEEQQLLAMLSGNEMAEGEFLNQIDGLSEYGFGDESDATAQFPPSSQGSDTEPAPRRHVRFDIGSSHALQSALSSSPTISRELLPSAMPELGGIYGGPASAAALAEHELEIPSEDDYDSDATDEDLPAEAMQQAAAENEDSVEDKSEVEDPTPAPAVKAASKKPQRKGPPRGIFIDEGTKASGILDPTGKIVLITHPHLLGEEFARRYGNSAPASPSTGFQELIDGSDGGESQVAGGMTAGADIDPFVAELAAQMADPASIPQPIAPQGPFFQAPSSDPTDYLLGAEMFDENDDLGEGVIDIDDVIKFDDSDDSDEPTSPIYMPPKNDLSISNANEDLSWYNSGITAFRNIANPNFTPGFNTTGFSQLAELSAPIHRTPSTRKRKRVIDSPYSSSHYAGVTPVQRMRDPNPPSAPATPDSDVRPKRRRRLMTA